MTNKSPEHWMVNTLDVSGIQDGGDKLIIKRSENHQSANASDCSYSKG